MVNSRNLSSRTMEGNHSIVIFLTAFLLTAMVTVADMEYQMDNENIVHQGRMRDSHLASRFSLRQPQSLYRGECSEEHFEHWYFNKLSLECRERFSNASTLQELFEVYCDPECWDMYYDYIDSCGNSGLMSTIFYHSMCSENENGVLCYNYLTSESHYNPKPMIEDNCDMNNDTCGQSCYEALEAFSMELGCCVNTLYNTSATDPVAGYLLWATCDVARPEFCVENNFSDGATNLASYLSYLNTLSIALLVLVMVAMK